MIIRDLFGRQASEKHKMDYLSQGMQLSLMNTNSKESESKSIQKDNHADK